MDRVFLDASVLFAVACQPPGGVLRLWRLEGLRLLSSPAAVAEATHNLADPQQRQSLGQLAKSLDLSVTLSSVPVTICAELPETDHEIVLFALRARASHLLTGDFKHFGRYFGKSVAGMLVFTPSQYFRQRGL